MNSFKIFIVILLICIGLAIFNLSMNYGMHTDLSAEDEILYRFLKEEGQFLEKKYHMRQCATGLGGMDKIWLMSLSFQRFGNPLNEIDSRELIIHCVDDFLEAINNNEELRPILESYPFTAKNLELTIFNYDKNQNSIYFPAIAVVSNSRGKIAFLTETATTKYGYHTEKYETYEEAVVILQNER